MTKRKYQEAWEILKNNKVILSNVTTSSNPIVITKHASTFSRGIQKEKYQDYAFRSKYPNAKLTSELDYTKKQIRISLDLQDYTSTLEEL